MPAPNEEFQRLDLDALLALVRDETDPDRLAPLWWEALSRTGCLKQWQHDELALPETLTDDQRRLAEALAAREDAAVVTRGIPGTTRLLRRWLGLTPPSILERRIAWTHDGAPVEWPLWKVWAAAPDASLEAGQGIPSELAERLTPAEIIEASGESLLEPYGLQYPFETRLTEALSHAADAAPWARGFIVEALRVRGPVGTDRLAGPIHVNKFAWDALAIITLLPLVRAGVPFEPAWDHFAPHGGPWPMVREILEAIPEARREAVVFNNISTMWGARGDQVLNGFWENLRALELAPSFRNARFVVSQFRNCRRYFAPSREKILARLNALAETHPDVALALKPARRTSAKEPAAKKPAAKKPAAKKKTSRG